MQKLSKGFRFNTYLLALLSIFLFIILLSFNSHSPSPKITTLDYKSAFPIIIDSLSKPASFLTRKHITEAKYSILYLGQEKDSIFLDRNSSPYKENVCDFFNTYNKYKGYDEAKIQLEIDFSQEIKDDANLTLKELFNDTFPTNNRYYKAYPVVIKNKEKKPIIIGHTGYAEQLSLILEAKDQTGEWRAIEEQFTYSCGFGIYPIILNPQEIIITALKIYQGSFKTELRLKFNHSNTYSRTFQGSIHPHQFKHSKLQDIFSHKNQK